MTMADIFTVSTDATDYAPGTTATITATVDAGDSVTFQVDHVLADGSLADDLSGTGLTWTVVDGGEGDADGIANGIILTSWNVGMDALGASLLLSGINLTSGATATTSFTDGQHDPVDSNPTSLGNGLAIVTGDVNTSTGTGIFPAFVQIQGDSQSGGTTYNDDNDSSTEEGFNTDFRPRVLDTDQSHIHNHALLFAQVPLVTLPNDPTQYREFRLDINESGSAKEISLDELQLYKAGAGNIGSLSGLVQIYDMDGGADGLTGGAADNPAQSIALTSWASGSGHSDYKFLIPNQYFLDANVGNGDFIYLYSAFSQADSGFEEWSVGPAVAAPSVVLIKTEIVYNSDGSVDDNNTIDSATDYIVYTVTVANNGNVDLTNVVVTDSFEGGSGLVLNTTNFPDLVIQGDGPQPNVLDVGEVWTYTYSHDVTPAEYAAALAGTDNGANHLLDNIATVTTDEGPTASDDAHVPVENGGGGQDVVSLQVDKYIVCAEDSDHTFEKGFDDVVPNLLGSGDVHYVIEVKNTGNVILDNLDVQDPDLTFDSGHTEAGGTGTNGDDIFDPGETWTFTGTAVWDDGTQTNTATATADFTKEGVTTDASDDDSASYFGVDFGSDSVTIKKYVSVDGGTTWDDADSPKGPTLLDGNDDPQYKLVITNTSNVDLTGVVVHDDNLDLNGADPGTDLTIDLAANDGASGGADEYTAFVTGTWAEGQNTNTAEASATYSDDCNDTADSSDSDDANYYGAAPSLTINKDVVCIHTDPETDEQIITPLTDGSNLIQGGGTVYYEITVTNDGNVDLTPTVTDDLLGALGDPTSLGANVLSIDESGGTAGNAILEAGETWTYIVTGTWEHKSVTNTAAASASYVDAAEDSQTASDDDTANYIGVIPALAILKTTNGVDTDQASPPQLFAGMTVTWDYSVTNTGDVAVALSKTTGITDDNGSVGTGDDFHPTYISGDTHNIGYVDLDETWLFETSSIATGGNYTNTANLSTTYTDDCGDDVTVTASDTSGYRAVTPTLVGLTKGFWATHLLLWDVVSGDEKGSGSEINVAPGYDWNKSGGITTTTNLKTTGSSSSLGLVNAANNGGGDSGLLIGDLNHDGLLTGDNGSAHIFFDLASAQIIANTSVSGDARLILASQAMASQLNEYQAYVYDQSHGGITLSNTASAGPNGLLGEAALWMSGQNFSSIANGVNWAPANMNFSTANDSNGILVIINDAAGTDYTISGGAITLKKTPILSSSNAAWNQLVAVTSYDPGTDSSNASIDNVVYKGHAASYYDTVVADGEGLKNALAYYNHGGNGTGGFVISTDGTLIGWQDSLGGNVYDVHNNTVDAFWDILADQNVLHPGSIAGIDLIRKSQESTHPAAVTCRGVFFCPSTRAEKKGCACSCKRS
jgi:uncharacterized repeat protein (TIGR01451 family)